MKVVWTVQALDDYRYWERTDPKVCARIKHLIDDIVDRDPFAGIGKLEAQVERLLVAPHHRRASVGVSGRR